MSDLSLSGCAHDGKRAHARSGGRREEQEARFRSLPSHARFNVSALTACLSSCWSVPRPELGLLQFGKSCSKLLYFDVNTHGHGWSHSSHLAHKTFSAHRHRRKRSTPHLAGGDGSHDLLVGPPRAGTRVRPPPGLPASGIVSPPTMWAQRK